MAMVRWIALLLVLGAVGWSAEDDAPTQAPVLEPGEDFAQLEALGWVAPWEVRDGVLLLRLKAPAGAVWTADDVVRISGESYRAAIQDPWEGALAPEVFEMQMWTPEADCQTLDLLSGQGAGSCQQESRMRLRLGLPDGAHGSGSVTIGFQRA